MSQHWQIIITLWGESKLGKMACSGSLAPHLVNNNCVSAEVIYTTAHAHHKVPAWSRATLCCGDMWTLPGKWQHYRCIMAVHWVSHKRRGYSVSPAMAAVSTRSECCYDCGCQPGERLCCVRLCYGCCQKRINVSAVPTDPQVFFQPLSVCLTYPGFSEQCGQCEQDQQYTPKVHSRP